MNQAIETLEGQYRFAIKGFNAHVADKTDLALVELGLADLLAAVQEGDQDRDQTCGSQADDRYTEEGVERGSRSEIDASEGALNDGL